MTLRTQAVEQRYQEARQSGKLKPLAQEDSIKDFVYWKVVENRFPHDIHHTKHHLVVLRRDCDPSELAGYELGELWRVIVPWAEAHYDYLKFNFGGLRSVKLTPHLHLLTLKPEFK